MTDPSRARTLISSVAVLLTIALLGTAASCTKEESTASVAEYLKKSHIYGKKKLRIGVMHDQPLMSYREEDGSYTGFDTDIARLIADGLGYSHEEEIEWVNVTVEGRIADLQGDTVDLVVASFTINDERSKLVSFAGPYFVTTQETLIRTADKNKIRTLDDLKTHSVCVTGGSTSFRNLQALGITPHPLETDEECVEGVRKGIYDAASTDETVLAGFRYKYGDELTIVNMPFGDSEPLGIGVPLEDHWLKDVIGHILLKNYQQHENSRWQAAYNSTLGKALGRKTQPAPLKVPELLDHDDSQPQGMWLPDITVGVAQTARRARRVGHRRGRR